MSGTQLAGIVGGEEVGTNLLVVRTEVQHDTLGTEASDDQTDDAAIAVKRNARLLTPHIEFLVEVPVGTVEGSITIEAPVLALQRFPDSLQCLVVLDVFLGLREEDRHLCIVGKLVVGNHESLALYRLSLVGSLHRTGLAVCSIRGNLIGTCREPYGRIAMGSSHIHILIVFVVRILILLASLLVFHLQVGEGEGFTGEEVGYAHINHADAGEEILLFSGTGLLPLLDEVELHLATLYGLHHQILLGQAASHNGEGLACRRGKQLLIYGIIEIETDDGVRT